MSEGSEVEKVPEPVEWSSEVARELAGDQKPFPIPVHVKDGVYYQEGVGHIDKDGNRIIGLPTTFYKSPFDIMRVVDDVEALKHTDKEIEDKTSADK